jgi:hypothetical protein
MGDVTDDADEHSAPLLDAQIQNIRNRAAKIPPGEPGDCDKCGEYFIRLVNGYCGFCRDKYKL